MNDHNKNWFQDFQKTFYKNMSKLTNSRRISDEQGLVWINLAQNFRFSVANCFCYKKPLGWYLWYFKGFYVQNVFLHQNNVHCDEIDINIIFSVVLFCIYIFWKWKLPFLAQFDIETKNFQAWQDQIFWKAINKNYFCQWLDGGAKKFLLFFL